MLHALLAITLAAASPSSPKAKAPGTPGSERAPARPSSVCAGEYAQDMSALQARARDREQRQPSYTFAIRTTAAYECPFYGADGELRRVRKRAVAHGTAFAYRQLQ